MRIVLLAAVIISLSVMTVKAGDISENTNAGSLPVNIAHASLDEERPEKPTTNDGVKVAVMCFSTGERTSGMNKICYYDCLESEAAITISSVSLCPLTINR